MAISPKDEYPGQTIDNDPDYPQGKARNVTVAGDGTGTPWEERLINDLFGFQQALLDEAGISPSGSPESAASSQYLDALRAIFVQLGGRVTDVGDDDLGSDADALEPRIHAPYSTESGRWTLLAQYEVDSGGFSLRLYASPSSVFYLTVNAKRVEGGDWERDSSGIDSTALVFAGQNIEVLKHPSSEADAWSSWAQAPFFAGDSIKLDAPVTSNGAAAYLLKETKYFTSDGTWTRPDGVRAVRVTCVGGGGAGGGVEPNSTDAFIGAGGGGGGTAIAWVTDPGSSEPVTVGSGGSGSSGSSGGDGGTSSFGTHASASGGDGGAHSNTLGPGNGGPGGEGTAGDVLIAGDDGDTGHYSGATFVGGMGHGGGSTHAGRRRPTSSSGTGQSGHAYGGGGSGATDYSATTTDRAGGDGADGIVIVEEYV